MINAIDLNYDYPYRCVMDDGSDDSWCTVKGLVEDKKVFTKKDLKNGDVVKKRNGNVEIIVLPLGTMVTKSNGFNTLAEMNDDLTDIDGDEAYDIVPVRRPSATHECTFGAFEYNLGKLIWEREEKKPLYNGKVVCIDNTQNPTLHTVGKIYQFKDGYLTADNGRKYPGLSLDAIHSFKEWEKWTGSKFIEIKE